MIRNIILFLWTVGYFYFSSTKIEAWRHFRVYSLKDWSDLFGSLDKINTPRNMALCLVLLLWIPLWIWGFCLIKKLFKKQKDQQIVQQATASHPFIPTYVPANMPSQGKSVSLPEMAPAPSTQNAETTQAQTDAMPEDLAQALDKVTKLAESKGLTPFPHVLLENILVPITISSDSDALLIKVLADTGSWHFDVKEPINESVCTKDNHSVLALKEIVLGKDILAKMEPEAVISSVLVLAKGTFDNLEDTVAQLNQHNIQLVRLSDNQDNNLKSLDELLDEKFAQTENVEEPNGEENLTAVQEPTGA